MIVSGATMGPCKNAADVFKHLYVSKDEAVGK
jgi:hypothetical protein